MMTMVITTMLMLFYDVHMHTFFCYCFHALFTNASYDDVIKWIFQLLITLKHY
jgi:hypothetical protein